MSALRKSVYAVNRRTITATLGAIAIIGSAGWATAQAQGATSANLAMVGEPQSLDPMASTADLVGTIMQHVYEPLFTFDANWTVQPMLAAALPTVSRRRPQWRIPLSSRPR